MELVSAMYVEVVSGGYGSATSSTVVNPLHVIRMFMESEYVTVLELSDGQQLRVEGSLAEMEALLEESLAAVGFQSGQLRGTTDVPTE